MFGVDGVVKVVWLVGADGVVGLVCRGHHHHPSKQYVLENVMVEIFDEYTRLIVASIFVEDP